MIQQHISTKRDHPQSQENHNETSAMPDKVIISIKVDGALIEVGKRYRDRDGRLRVAWLVPPSRVEEEILFIHF